MKTILFTLLCASACIAQDEVFNLPPWPLSRVCVRLIGEDGRMMPKTNCSVGFTHPGRTWHNYKFVSAKGITDSKGEFWAEERTMDAVAAASEQDGCYISQRGVKLTGWKDDKWLPFPSVEVLMVKKIGNPVAMYAAANLELILPKKEGVSAFDLEKRDWVAPDGAGERPDLLFSHERKSDIQGLTATLRITFSNPGDGLIPVYEAPGIESELILPRTAPADGYETERKFTERWGSYNPPPDSGKPVLGYFYRVRTVLDEQGKVKSALYGKINGDFQWQGRHLETGKVTFTYYLNPDGTRNLEFDRKKNLFRDLTYANEVKKP